MAEKIGTAARSLHQFSTEDRSRESVLKMALGASVGNSIASVTSRMLWLADTLEGLEYLRKIDPHFLRSVVARSKYKCTNILSSGLKNVSCFLALSDSEIVIGGDKGSLQVWQRGHVGYQQTLGLVPHHGAIRAIQALPHGALAVGSDDGTMSIVSCLIDGRAQIQKLQEHSGAILQVRAFPDGRIATGCSDGAVRVWIPDGAGAYEATIVGEHKDPVVWLQACVDGRIVSADTSEFRLWIPDAHGVFRSRIIPITLARDTLRDAQVLGDGTVVIGCANAKIYVYNQILHHQYSPVEVIDHSGVGVRCLQVLPDGRIVTGGDDALLRIWSKAPSGEWSRCIVGGCGGLIRDVQVLAGGALVSGSDSHVVVWD